MLKILSIHKGHGPFTILNNGHYAALCCVNFQDTTEHRRFPGARNFHVNFTFTCPVTPEVCEAHDLSPVLEEFVSVLQTNADELKRVVGLSGDDHCLWKIKEVRVLRVHDRAGLLLDQLNIHWPAAATPE